MAKQKKRSFSLGSGSGEELWGGSVFCGLVLGNALQLPKEDLACAVRVLLAPATCTVRRMCGRAADNHHGHPAKVEVELLALTDCMDCIAGCVK